MNRLETGALVRPEDYEKVFDPFHSSKGHGGTGLGLAAARKIVTEMDGTIEIKTAEGNGTTFLVRLPTDPTRIISKDELHAQADPNSAA